jgi:hypothetical protein
MPEQDILRSYTVSGLSEGVLPESPSGILHAPAGFPSERQDSAVGKTHSFKRNIQSSTEVGDVGAIGLSLGG